MVITVIVVIFTQFSSKRKSPLLNCIIIPDWKAKNIIIISAQHTFFFSPFHFSPTRHCYGFVTMHYNGTHFLYLLFTFSGPGTIFLYSLSCHAPHCTVSLVGNK